VDAIELIMDTQSEFSATIDIDRVNGRLLLRAHEHEAPAGHFDIDDVTPPGLVSRYQRLVVNFQDEALAGEADVGRALRAIIRLAANGALLTFPCTNGRSPITPSLVACFALTPILGASSSDQAFRFRASALGQYQARLVSILIAAWNPRYFEKALRSALAQSYRNIEIVVCDDSREGSIKEIVDRCQDTSIPIHYERNPERLMTRKNYERCFALARGEFIKFLNDDDWLEARCVERLVAALDSEPTAVLATSARSLVDEHGGPKHDWPATEPLFREDRFVDGQSLGTALLLLGLNFIGEPSTTLFRASAAQIGQETLFDFRGAQTRGIVDFLLWTRLLCRGDAVYLRERLSNFRIHPEQRQAVSEVRGWAVESIPALRQKWIELGLHFASPPNLLRARSVGQKVILTNHLVPGFAPPDATLSASLDHWRNQRHPFFTSAA
jgi:Glycosyl transferase family 2